ncbi:hypothetical protein [Paenibacillus taichungensis]
MKNDRYVFEETKCSEWVQSIQVNGQEVEIRNYGIDMPRGYVIGFVVNGNELERISTGSPKFMKLVRRTNLLQRLTGKIPSITKEEFLQHLNVWGNIMIKKYSVL